MPRSFSCCRLTEVTSADISSVAVSVVVLAIGYSTTEDLLLASSTFVCYQKKSATINFLPMTSADDFYL